MKPIAIVTPWFGKELKGGAEQFVWQVATRLAHRGHAVEVLTTCCRSFLDDWSENHLKAGTTTIDNLVTRRFPVDKRNGSVFNDLNQRLLQIPHHMLKPYKSPVSAKDSQVFVNENINSKALLKHLKGKAGDYTAFIFAPYLYGPILKGVPLVKEKAILLPCLHDEVYAYLSAVKDIFLKAGTILYNSTGEAILAENLYGPAIAAKGVVVGGGVEVPECKIAGEITHAGPVNMTSDRYVLYLGRRDNTKNVGTIVSAFNDYRHEHYNSSLKLVLAGPGNKSYDNTDGQVYDLGLVSEEEKAALLHGALALFQPSRNESYSRVIMEAWLAGKPVGANSACLSTAATVQDAGGGWLADTPSQWSELFHFINTQSTEYLSEAANKGRRYAECFANWDRVIDKYEEVLGTSTARVNAKPHVKGRLKEIHQITTGATVGDAITNAALSLRDYIRTKGYSSNIYVEHLDPKLYGIIERYRDGEIPDSAAVIYHHSIGTSLTQSVIKHKGAKCLVYHNITPAEFFAHYNSEMAEMLEQGRRNLHDLSQHFKLSLGDSFFNVNELADVGFVSPEVLPLIIDPNKLNTPLDTPAAYSTPLQPEDLDRLYDGNTNIIFIGRIAPNKCQHHLIEAFSEYISMDSGARLILIGGFIPGEAYHILLLNLINKYSLRDHVILTNKVCNSDLHEYYRSAHLLWSMSEHEGFGIPFIEAMWYNVPVLAYKCTAVPETLGYGGLMFTSKSDLKLIAAAAKVLVHDDTLRGAVLRAQRHRREDFLPERVYPVIDALIEKLESQ